MVNTTPDFSRAKRCVDHYRSLGLCPLPSRMDIKGPMLPTYAEHYGPTPVPESAYADWRTTNVQIITGAKSPTPAKIVVVDCDGPKAHDVWKAMCAANNYTPNGAWVCRTGSGGHHYYFSLPSAESCPGGMLWGIWDTWGDNGKGKWLRHEEVRLLGDRALVIAPPSIHVETGSPYSFDSLANPNKIRLPVEAPAWLLAMPLLATPRCYSEPPRPPVAPPRPARTSDRWYTRDEVLDAIGGRKLAEAKTWGLVTKSDMPNPSGWVVCWVPGREDPRHSNPSGSFNFRDGTLQDRKDLSTISLFDLGVLLGRYSTWQECRDELGDRYVGKRGKEAAYKYAY